MEFIFDNQKAANLFLGRNEKPSDELEIEIEHKHHSETTYKQKFCT